MKKSKIAIICFAALLTGLFSGCGLIKKEAAASPEPSPITNQDEETVGAGNAQNPSPKPSDEAIEYPAEKEYVIAVEGTEEKVNMQLFDLVFSEKSGSEAGIYIDKTRYEVAYLDSGEFGRYIIMPINNGESSTFMEISYIPNTTIDDMASIAFAKYSEAITTEDTGDSEIENGSARVIKGQSNNGASWTAYIIEADGGVLTSIMRVEAEAAEGHGTRLLASAKTIFVK